MARRTSVTLQDDLDGGPAEETLRFGISGAEYEIDLSSKNAARLRSQLAPFIEHARKAGKMPRRAVRTAASRRRSREIRSWAQAQGIELSERGRIPASVAAQYEARTTRKTSRRLPGGALRRSPGAWNSAGRARISRPPRSRAGRITTLRLRHGRETEGGSEQCRVREQVVTAPGVQDIRAVQRRLRASQGTFVPKPRLPVIDELVATVLSQHTSDTNSERAFAQLKARFPNWRQVADAPVEQVASTIRCGGIADQKARRIQQILSAIEHREGSLDLSRLHDLDDAAAEAYLLSLPGVGRKTAACVLAFSMGRPAFPVDTHVHRVAIRLGWIKENTTADRAHQLIAPRVPPGIAYDLHLAMISHGRTVCRAQQPRCGTCVLRDLCAYGSATSGAGAG